MGIGLTDAVEPLGSFAIADASDIRGGLHGVLDNTARDAIPASRRSEGMIVYVTSTSLMYQLRGGILNADWQLFETGAGSVTRQDYMLASMSSTELTTTTPEIIGGTYFNPNDIIPVSSGRTRHVNLEVLLHTSTATYAAVFRVYDYDGITNGGVPIVVTGSLVTTSALTPTRITASLDAALGTIITPGRLFGQLAVTAPGPGFAVCEDARLVVTWDV